MCFSAGASFGASALLAGAGVVAIAKVKTFPQRLFALIPFMFSVQQFSEGMLWLSLKNQGLATGQSFFMYVFLLFAMVIWPVWIPFTIRLPEQDAKRKKIMNILLGIGIFVSAGSGSILLLYPVEVVSVHHHIHYRLVLPPAIKNIVWIFNVLYFLATTITPFVSGIKRMKWLGIVSVISFLVAIILYAGFVVSVWCYFAAILSIVIIWILPDFPGSVAFKKQMFSSITPGNGTNN